MESENYAGSSLSPLERLKNIGFRQVGEWRMEADKYCFVLHEYSRARNILYAFVLDGEVVYVGKTVQSLKERMNGYQNPGATQSTNIKGNNLILSSLGRGKRVEIYALPDNGLLYYGGFHINLAAGLEDSLLSLLMPAWNKIGT